MRTKKMVLGSLLFLLFSIGITTTNLLAKPVAGCYFCLNDGTYGNECYGASGSGWTVCESGGLHCGLGGSSCINQ